MPVQETPRRPFNGAPAALPAYMAAEGAAKGVGAGAAEAVAGDDGEDTTQPLPALEPREARAEPAGTNPFAPLGAALADPARRRWVVIGAVALLAVVSIIVAGLATGARRPLAPAAPPAEQAAPAAEPAPAEGQPAAEAPPVPAAPPAEAPAAEAPPATAPAEGEAPAAGAEWWRSQVALAALPLLLGVFWLLSAWLVNAEARRAFVVQEPWGDRRTIAYSCLAVGCVTPLILAGLIFGAYGWVTFVLFIGRREGPVAGIQAGALILLGIAVVLLLRGAVARWYAGRRAQPF